MLHLGALQVNY